MESQSQAAWWSKRRLHRSSERGPKLTKNQSTYLAILKANQPITTENLNDKLREVGMGIETRSRPYVTSGSRYKPRG